MKKKYSWILIVILLILIGGYGYVHNIASANSRRVGLNLDCARVYYSPNVIKKYIDDVHNGHGTYIQLHLTDNERFGVENSYLNQTPENAIRKGDTYYNKSTHLAFLSKSQLKDIIEYGESKHIEVIPEIEFPGHAAALLKLLSYNKQNRSLVKEIKNSDDEMYYQKNDTLKLSEKILSEYTPLLPKGNHVGIGGDEISIVDHSDDLAIVKYVNSLNRFLNKRGLQSVVWNDSFRKAVLNKYDKNILVYYWSQSGEDVNTYAYKDHIKTRATMPELNKAGIKTINGNDYYTYVVVDPATFTKSAKKLWFKNIGKWNYHMWDDVEHQRMDKSKNNIGASISIWNEPTAPYSGERTYQLTQPFVQSFFKQVEDITK